MRTKRERKNAFKAQLLDVLSDEVVAWDFLGQGEEAGLTDDECAEIAQQLSEELYRRAVKLTPLGEP